MCVTKPGQDVAGIAALTHGTPLGEGTAFRRSGMEKYQLLDRKDTKEEQKHSPWTGAEGLEKESPLQDV